jgi:signal transduction histidine kinase
MLLSYPDFKVVEINKKGMYLISEMLNIDNIKMELIQGKSIERLIPQFNTGENYRCICEMVQDKKSIQLNDLKISVKDEDIHINLIYQPVIGLDSEINEFLIIMNDITSEVIKRQKVEELMRMQEEFFSFITHEFRTPLTTISSSIQIMDQIYKNEITPNIRRNINMIRRNTYQQLRLVNSLLDITRAEAGYLKVHRKNLNIVDMTRLIIESVNFFAETKGVHIVFSSLLNEKTIAVDDEKYERILLNLLSNAIRFTPRGKDICVKVSSYGDKVYIQVKDQGIGIPKDKQRIIFDRFGQVGSTLTRQSEGTGIGLYLVKLLVKALDGDILLESEEGCGTSFTIVLPDVILPEGEEVILPEITENRLVRSANLEFANIYLD